MACKLGRQIKSAYDLYKLENGVAPENLTTLLSDGRYLRSVPKFGDTGVAVSNWYQSGGGTFFLVKLGDSKVCTQINSDQKRGTLILDTFTGDMGCARENDGIYFFLALEDGPFEDNTADADQTPVIPAHKIFDSSKYGTSSGGGTGDPTWNPPSGSSGGGAGTGDGDGNGDGDGGEPVDPPVDPNYAFSTFTPTTISIPLRSNIGCGVAADWVTHVGAGPSVGAASCTASASSSMVRFSQTFPLPPSVWPVVDAGVSRITIGSERSSYNKDNDTARQYIRCLDENNVPMSTYLTAGFGAKLGIFQLDLATWGEEAGTSSNPVESRRYMLEMSIDF